MYTDDPNFSINTKRSDNALHSNAMVVDTVTVGWPVEVQHHSLSSSTSLKTLTSTSSLKNSSSIKALETASSNSIFPETEMVRERLCGIKIAWLLYEDAMDITEDIPSHYNLDSLYPVAMWLLCGLYLACALSTPGLNFHLWH
jgi:hypothetical protein